MSQSFISTPQNSATLRVIGETIRVLADSDRTGGLEVFAQEGPAGVGPPPHSHPWDETFVVLEGRVSLWIQGQTRVLGAGELAFIPKETLHTFKMESAAKMISINDRPGASKFFTDLDRELGGTVDIPKILAVAADNRVMIPPPPDGAR